ncbi:GNAT family N-acetyltransferase [Candidatus Bathyarchaeota archaeon]|nr:GNAT family N-acetyltransferase [Candidatus Bathyarchaeota archaeon]
MEFCKVKEVEFEDIDSLIYLCIPPESRNSLSLVEVANAKKKWVKKNLEIFGEVAKIACVNEAPAGLIQYQPKLEEKLLEITCIFVPDWRNQQRGVGKVLLNALIRDAEKPKPYFDNAPPLALVTWAFSEPGYYPQTCSI